MTVELYGYCDVSKEAYTAVIHIKVTYTAGSTSSYLVLVKTRVAPFNIPVNLIPAKAGRFNTIKENSTDAAPRRLTASELQHQHFWWQGPPWLLRQPVRFSKQPSSATLIKLQEEEAKPQPCHSTTAIPAETSKSKFNSYNKLVKVICWIKRLALCIRNKTRKPEKSLSTPEARKATQVCIHRSQNRFS